MRAARILGQRGVVGGLTILTQLCEERGEELLRASTSPNAAAPPRLASIPPQPPYSVGSNPPQPKANAPVDRLSPPRKIFQPTHIRSLSEEDFRENRATPDHMAPRRTKWTAPPPEDSPADDQAQFESNLGLGLTLATLSSDARQIERSFASSSSNSDALTDDDALSETFSMNQLSLESPDQRQNVAALPPVSSQGHSQSPKARGRVALNSPEANAKPGLLVSYASSRVPTLADSSRRSASNPPHSPPLSSSPPLVSTVPSSPRAYSPLVPQSHISQVDQAYSSHYSGLNLTRPRHTAQAPNSAHDWQHVQLQQQHAYYSQYRAIVMPHQHIPFYQTSSPASHRQTVPLSESSRLVPRHDRRGSSRSSGSGSPSSSRYSADLPATGRSAPNYTALGPSFSPMVTPQQTSFATSSNSSYHQQTSSSPSSPSRSVFRPVDTTPRFSRGISSHEHSRQPSWSTPSSPLPPRFMVPVQPVSTHHGADNPTRIVNRPNGNGNGSSNGNHGLLSPPASQGARRGSSPRGKRRHHNPGRNNKDKAEGGGEPKVQK